MIKKEKWKPYLAFAVLVFALYGNTLNHSYVCDDAVYISGNKFTQQGVKGIPDLCRYDMNYGILLSHDERLTVDKFNEMMRAFANDGGNRRFRPLSYITFALEVEFFGKEITVPNTNNQERFKGNAFVSHLINMLLYLFTACLLFSILRLLASMKKSSLEEGNGMSPSEHEKWYFSFPFIVTLLYLCHPIHTEIVANVKSRAEIMALLGALGALWFTLKYIDTNKYRTLLYSGLCLFGGLLSKENTIVFLAIIPLTLYYFTDSSRRKLMISIVPLLVAIVVFFVIRIRVLGWAFTSEIYPDILNEPFVFATTSERLATIFVTLLNHYIRLLFFPHPMTYDYSPRHIEITGWSNPVALCSLLFYVSLGLYAVYGMIKKKDVCSYAIWLYLIPLSVVSNLFYRTGMFMNERFIYFSSIGFAMLTGWIIYKIPALRRSSKRIAVAVLALTLGLYSAKTISRNRVWKDNFTLFTTDVITSKNGAMANNHAGQAYLKKVMYPDNSDEAQRKDEYCEKAAQYLLHAIQLDTQYIAAHENLGYLYFNCNRDVAQAIHYFTRLYQLQAQRINAKIDFHVEALNMIPALLNENKITSTPKAIIQSLDDLLNVRPDIGEAWYVRGVIYGQRLNNIEMAIMNFERALSMDFHKTEEFYVNIGVAYAKAENYSKSIQYLLKAEELGGNAPIIYYNLGVIYHRLGDSDKSDFYIRKLNEMRNK